MKYKRILTAIVLSIMALAMFSGTNSVLATQNSFTGYPELDIPLTYLYAYTTDYFSEDAIVTGNTIDLSSITGLTLQEDDTQLDLSGTVIYMDDFIIEAGVSLYDLAPTYYNKIWLNKTYDQTLTNTSAPTSFSFNNVRGHANFSTGTAVTGNPTASDFSYLGYDANQDGDYADATDRDYLPLPSTNLWFWSNFMVDHSASINAGSYGETVFSFETDSGTNYDVLFRAYQGNGDSGWVVGATADNQAIFNHYDADGDWLAMGFNLQALLQADTTDAISPIGIDHIGVRSNFEAADEWTDFQVKSFGVFNSVPALTDRIDEDDDWDMDYDAGSGGVPLNTQDDDTDILISEITEGATDTVDSTVALIQDYTGSMTTLANGLLFDFSGVASVQPSSAKVVSSNLVTGETYYLTTVEVVFNTRSLGVEPSKIDTFANVYSMGEIQFNFTLDKDDLVFYPKWVDNLIVFDVDGIPQINTFKGSWVDSTADLSEIQYNLPDFDASATTGLLQTVKYSVFTEGKKSGSSQVSITSVADVPTVDTVSSGSSTMIIWIAVIGLGILTLLYARNKKWI